MSITVKGLTKKFGDQTAVDHIDFRIDRGEVVGFLGPNGAGKSTTMKMLCCFMPPTEGEASVCGHHILNEPMAVRRQIGYLPETNPLYIEMYVREYLHFVAGIHGVKNADNRVEEMIERTGLREEQHKKIGALSKGYRQRIGLAQAMIHDPEVLILDEPTSGLDPNQLVEIRTLIKNFGREKTVLFSSHIMQEVQAICDRVLIIHRGKLVADAPIEHLSERMEEERFLIARWKDPVDEDQLIEDLDLFRLEQTSKGEYRLFHSDPEQLKESIFRWSSARDNPLMGLEEGRSSVEEVFQRLTKE